MSTAAGPLPFWAVLEVLMSEVAGTRKCRLCEDRDHVADPAGCIAVADCQRAAAG